MNGNARCVFFLALLTFGLSLSAQESLKISSISDSLKPIVSKDTAAPPPGVDTLIYYGADTTDGSLDRSIVILRNHAWVRYKGLEIKAAKITIDQPKKLMTAEAMPDSIDSTGTVVRFRGLPEFSEGGQLFHGQTMEYNFETKRGKVTQGDTKLQDGFYYGRTIRKIGDSTLYIRGGRFTTCDVPEPHFYLQTQEMKMIVRDQVVAKPVVLHIHEVPIFAIPFGVFPTKGGRASGLTPPVYFETPQGERQVRNFGYYWAPSDYFDFLFQADYLDKSGYQFHGSANYAQRYRYTGHIDYSYSRLHSLNYTSINDDRTEAGSAHVTHSQTLSERSNLNADIQYQSTRNYTQQTSINQQQILNRQQNSNVSYNSSYDWGGISANLQHTKNLDNGASTLTFPSVNTSKSSSAVIAKSEADKDKPDTWYQAIRYSYNNNLLGQRSQQNDTADLRTGLGMRHNVGISAPIRVFEYFNLNPNLNVEETWYDRRNENYGYRTDGRDTSVLKKGFYAKHTFSTGASLSTKVYGTANPDVLGVKTLRHVMSPSVSLTYQPDFSTERWGYYETVRDTAGRKIKKDRYGQNLVFAGTPQGRSLSMGFGLGHVFQAKVTGTDTAGKSEERKLDLLNVNNSLSYNFEADSLKLSNLSTSISVASDLAKNITLSMSMVHDFYRYDRVANRRYDAFRDLPRLVSATITGGFSLQGGDNIPGGTAVPGPAPQGNYGQNYMPASRELPAGVPWDAKFDFNYDINRADPDNVTKNFGANVSAGVKLTPNWQASYSARLDLLKKDIVSQSVSFIRDLHCWTMRFDWTPTGPAAGFFFIVQVKSPQLQDLKLQRTDYGNRIFQ